MKPKRKTPELGKGKPAPPGKTERPGRFAALLYNRVSMVGMVLILLSLPSILFFVLLETGAEESPAYMGLVYMLLLVILTAGLMLVPAGMLLERRRLAKGGAPAQAGQWVIDLARPRHRNTLLVFLLGGIFASLIMATGTYRVFKATESNAFCGNMCHSVMRPEFVAYQYSSHARVKCVECHIGSGAAWYLRSKLSGLRQILAVMTNSYPRPIPTPIQNLRPARETCEECHWPSKFIGYREMVRTYYLSDEQNTPFKIRMLMKIGGEKSKLAPGSGIHYHMLIASRVEYIARDPRRQEIPWVRIHRSDGSVTEYNNRSAPLTEDEKEALPVRVMDCLDCHNRPSHQFPAPMNAVNSSIEQDLISSDLPQIKLAATRALDTDYESTESALAGLASHLRNFYRENYPAVIEEKPERLRKAIQEVQRIYRRSIFPEMKAKWSAYPDNIGHRDWPGCFRCHNEDMESKEGFTIFTTCDKCHLILAQGADIDRGEVNYSHGLPFLHPGDKEFIEEYSECVDCHNGGAEVYD